MLDRTTLTPVVAFVTSTTSSVLALIVSASVSRTWSEEGGCAATIGQSDRRRKRRGRETYLSKERQILPPDEPVRTALGLRLQLATILLDGDRGRAVRAVVEVDVAGLEGPVFEQAVAKVW